VGSEMCIRDSRLIALQAVSVGSAEASLA
jgi:hypothetical protein